jgi:hypothetical protein
MGAVLKSLEVQSRALASLVNASSGMDLGGGATDGVDFAPRLGGTRGAAALEAWRQTLISQPELVTKRIRANRDLVLGGAACLPGPTATMRGYPFGNARTAAYLMFGLADICELMEAGQWKLAEAHVHLLLAAGEQAPIQNWQWPLAWLLTQLPELAWQRIRHQPLPETARSMSRLADQSLLAAAVSYYRDVATVMDVQRRAVQGQAAVSTTGGAQGAPPGEAAQPKGKGPRRLKAPGPQAATGGGTSAPQGQGP